MRIIKEGSIEKNGKCHNCGTEFVFSHLECDQITEQPKFIAYKIMCPLKECHMLTTILIYRDGGLGAVTNLPRHHDYV